MSGIPDRCDGPYFPEKTLESGMYVGTVPGLSGAHTYAEAIDKFQERFESLT